MQEPPTTGKVILHTTVGDIDIELWSRECPKACRNFIQLCMERYYNKTIFHRVVKDFLVQGGDPDGDGTGGESIYGRPFNDEFHSRLRFNRRGLLAMATTEVNANQSQFFFTMGATPEFQEQNTLFGKVVGNTIYNMLKLQECEVNQNERPIYPHKIISTTIVVNPFKDIVPRKSANKVKESKGDSKRDSSMKAIKNFGLLSFGEEAEVDEIETSTFIQKNAGKGKSMHDAIDDPKLSKQSVHVEKSMNSNEAEFKYLLDQIETRLETIKKNCDANESKENESMEENVKHKDHTDKDDDDDSSDDDSSDADYLRIHDEEKRLENAKKRDKIRQDIRELKREYHYNKLKREMPLIKLSPKRKKDKLSMLRNVEGNEYIKDFLDDRNKYQKLKSQIPLKGASREAHTLDLLTKFRSKLSKLRTESSQNSNTDGNKSAECSDFDDDEKIEKDIQTDAWLCHTFRCKNKEQLIVAKDASTKDDHWYDIYDPRHPINKRKRKHAAENSNIATKQRL